ncbi:HIPL1 protein-like isoform X1 [Physcomitrium patens]|uniref:HIPL1 protein-like isoform X1 n=1 Tax=Physcomitrium patens TaxID=3218 RepID=UPI003CCCD458
MTASFSFSGTPLKVPQLIVHNPPAGICLTKLEDAQKGYFLNLIPHPDDSDRVFLNTQARPMYMATIFEPGSGKPLTTKYSKLFSNICFRTKRNSELGLMGMFSWATAGFSFPTIVLQSSFSIARRVCGCSSVNRYSNVSKSCTWSAIVA